MHSSGRPSSCSPGPQPALGRDWQEADGLCELLFAELASQRDLLRQGRRRRSRNKPRGQPAAPKAPKCCLEPLWLHSSEAQLRRARQLLQQRAVPPPQQWLFCRYPSLDRAQLHLAFAEGLYGTVQAAIRQLSKAARIQPGELELELEALWNDASYRLEELQRRQHLLKHGFLSDSHCRLAKLTAVAKYRIRCRNPCPTTPKKYNISQSASLHLSRVFVDNPRPSRDLKDSLALQVGLRPETVSNWFKNRRQRSRAAARAKLAASSTSTGPTGAPQEAQPAPAPAAQSNNTSDDIINNNNNNNNNLFSINNSTEPQYFIQLLPLQVLHQEPPVAQTTPADLYSNLGSQAGSVSSSSEGSQSPMLASVDLFANDSQPDAPAAPYQAFQWPQSAEEDVKPSLQAPERLLASSPALEAWPHAPAAQLAVKLELEAELPPLKLERTDDDYLYQMYQQQQQLLQQQQQQHHYHQQQQQFNFQYHNYTPQTGSYCNQQQQQLGCQFQTWESAEPCEELVPAWFANDYEYDQHMAAFY